MDECIFCKIINREIPSTIVYEDEDVLAFRDLDPKAPTHFLVIPKQHIPSAACIGPDNEAIMGKVMSAIAKIAKDMGLEEKGFRIVINTGEDAGQTVHHIHFHVMSGRKFAWPAG